MVANPGQYHWSRFAVVASLHETHMEPETQVGEIMMQFSSRISILLVSNSP